MLSSLNGSPVTPNASSIPWIGAAEGVVPPASLPADLFARVADSLPAGLSREDRWEILMARILAMVDEMIEKQHGYIHALQQLGLKNGQSALLHQVINDETQLLKKMIDDRFLFFEYMRAAINELMKSAQKRAEEISK